MVLSIGLCHRLLMSKYIYNNHQVIHLLELDLTKIFVLIDSTLNYNYVYIRDNKLLNITLR